MLLLLSTLGPWLSSDAPFQGQKKDPFLPILTFLLDSELVVSSHPDTLPVYVPCSEFSLLS